MNDSALTKLFLRFRDRHKGSALAAVFDALAREMLEVAAHLVRDVDEAEDLVQTTFRIAIERAETFEADRSVRAWLYGILVKEAAKSKRRAARRAPQDLVQQSSYEPPDSLVEAELPAVLQDAVGKLRSPYREVVEEVICRNRSPREVAQDLERAPGTVRVQVQRGIEKLRRLLPKEYGQLGLAFLPARGLDALRESVLRQSGATKTGLPTGLSVATESALAMSAVNPLLWLGPLLGLILTGAWLVRPSEFEAFVGAEQGRPEVDDVSQDSESQAVPLNGSDLELGEAQSARRIEETTRRVPVQPAIRHPEHPQIVGVVRDETDQPVTGVIVRATQDPDDGFPALFRTDAKGLFSFADLEPGWWFFSVDDPSYAVVWWRKFGARIPEAGSSPADLKLQLYDPRSVRGVVLDEDGAPVADARVTLAVERVDGEDRAVQGHLTHTVQAVRTDERGAFRLGRLAPGEMRVVLDHKSYARTLTSFRTDEVDTRLVVERGATLRGVVRAGAKPLAGVRVTAAAPSRSKLSMGFHEAVTEPDGSFEIDRIHSFHDLSGHAIPTVTVRVADEGWVSSAYQVYETERLRLPNLTIEAVPSGQVVEPAVVDVGRDLAREAEVAGEPYGEASISVRISPEALLEEGWTEAIWLNSVDPEQERFYRNERLGRGESVVFEGLPAGTYRISAMNGGGSNLQPVEIDVLNGERAEVELSPGTIKLQGRIRCGGQAVSEVRVFCTGPMRGRGTVFDDGSYEVSGLVPGTYELSTWSPSGFDNFFEVMVEPGAGSQFDLDLPRGEIRGIVRDVKFSRDKAEVQVFPRGWGTVSGNRGSRATVQEDGSFQMRFVPPGDYNVFLWNTIPRARIARVRITAGDPTHHVLLEPPPATTQVSGRIRSANPATAERSRLRRGGGTSLMLIPQDADGYLFGLSGGYATVESDGSFLLDDVEPGTYGVRVWPGRPGDCNLWLPDLHVPPSGLSDLDLLLPLGRRVQITLDSGERSTRQSIWFLRVPTGERIPFYSYIGSSPRGLRAGSTAFTLPFGEYTVEADFDGRVVEQALVVEPGEGLLQVVVRLE